MADGFQQLADVVGCGGLFFQHTGGVPHGVRRIMNRMSFNLAPGQSSRPASRDSSTAFAVATSGWCSPAAGGDHRNGELRHPLHSQFIERPLAFRPPPGAAQRFQRPEAVQRWPRQIRPTPAQIEIQYLLRGFVRPGAGFFCCCSIPLEADGGRGFGNRPSLSPTISRRSMRRSGAGSPMVTVVCSAVLASSAGAGALAQGRQRRRDGGFDDVGG